MDIFFSIVFFVLSFLITTFSFTNFVLTLICGFPCTTTLIKCGIVRNEAIKILKARNLRVFIIHFFICVVSLLIVLVFFREYIGTYLFGSVFSLIFGLKSYRLNTSTISDFLQTTIKYLSAKNHSTKPIFQSLPPLNSKQRLIYSVIEQVFPKEIDMHRFDSAYLRVKDYANGLYDDEPSHNQGRLFLLNIRCIGFCLGWCIFHGNQDKQRLLLETKNQYYNKIKQNSSNAQGVSKLIEDTEEMYFNTAKEMIEFKKTVIDPSYKEDSSKDNYNRLLKVFLELVCELNGIEWYDGIFEDFKHCMDEE